MINTSQNRLLVSISKAFNCPVKRPIPLGTLLHYPKKNVHKIVISVRWSTSLLDWEYQLIDTEWKTEPIWSGFEAFPPAEAIDVGVEGSPESVLLEVLTPEQLALVAEWIAAESTPNAQDSLDPKSALIAESFGYTAYRLRTIANCR